MFQLLSITTILALCTGITVATNVNGYHYEKPSIPLSLVSGPSNHGYGHSFGTLSTIKPLPPVPALPPLPTPRSKGQTVLTRTLYQTHPTTRPATDQSAYLPAADTDIGKIAQQYQPTGVVVATTPSVYGFSSSAPSTGFGATYSVPSATPGQPLRVPYGKQAVINYPKTRGGTEETYEANGRRLKQYAVIEIIDNDIEQMDEPMLTSPFFDSFRAHTGPSGIGAVPVSANGNGGGIQFGPRSSFEQQPSTSNSQAVALGSGGLGFIRLANGNVYLGSGSLGYVSGQQRTQSINEARTRTGASQPDAVHFGHGPLGNPLFNKFFYRYK